MAGRTVLAKSILSGIPSYIMSYIKISEGVIKTMEKS